VRPAPSVLILADAPAWAGLEDPTKQALNGDPLACGEVGDGSSGWLPLNETPSMGATAPGVCRVGPEGLVLEAEVVEQGAAFVSCRSPLFSLP